MDPKETSSSLWKFNKKGVGQCSFSRAERVEYPGSISFKSPLKSSSLDSHLKKTASVDVKEHLSPYRVSSSHSGLPLQLEDQTQIVVTNVIPSPFKPGLSQIVFQRDTRSAQTTKPASTLSSMVSDTSVHYLNDQSKSFNVTREPAHHLATPKGAISCSSTQDQQSSQGFHEQMESLQNSSPNCTSQRLQSLRRQQTDDKLEKLKDRIRRQREHVEETADKKELLGSVENPVGSAQLNLQSCKTVHSAHVRKVITAPPVPAYKGFNTTEINSHAPVVKTCQEDLTRLRREIYRDLTRQLTGEGTRTSVRCRERSKGKKSNRPIRKVHRSDSVADSEPRQVAATTASTWREGQKLVKMVLGPPLQTQPKTSPVSGDVALRIGGVAHPPNGSLSVELNRGQKNEDGKAAAVHLSADIQDILDDLELDTAPRKGVEKVAKKPPRVKTKDYGSVGLSLTASTTRLSSKEALKPDQVRRKRHYDSAAVRQYISRQQVERRRQQTEERRSQLEETERKNQRLQELYRKQKESFNKTTSAATTPSVTSASRCLLETSTKMLPEQTHLETDVLFRPFTSTHQQRPLYQPSNESDKENKHQNRPQSASSGDTSVPESPVQTNEFDVPKTSSCVQSSGQCSSPRAVPSGTPPTQTYPQWLGKEYKHSAPNATVLHASALPSSVTTMTSRMSRLEVLKSTATSLSNRIENEARKLLLTCKGSQLCVSELGVDLGSSNINAVPKPDHSKENILKLHCSGLTPYDDSLPGVGNLYTCREPNTMKNVIPSCIRERNIGQFEEEKSICHHDHLGSNSSFISEDNQTERKTSSQQSSMHVTVLDIDCIQQESMPLHQISVVSTGTDKLFTSAVPQDASTATWKELTKGSPHSVINIFTKYLPNNSNKVVYNRSERFSPITSSDHSEGHQENNFTSNGTNSSGQKVIRNPNRYSRSSSANKQGSSPKEDLKYLKSGIQSFSPMGSQMLPLCSASDSLDMEASINVKLVKGQDDEWSADTEPRSLGSLKESSKGNSPHSSFKGLDTDSTTGADSVYSLHSLFVHSKTSQKTTLSSSADYEPPTTFKGTVNKEGVRESSTPSWAPPNISQGNAGRVPSIVAAEPVVNAAGELQCGPGALQQRMAAELMYLDSIEESIRQLSDVERIRGVSLAQQEALSLAHVLKSQQHAHEQDLHQLNLKTDQDFESRIEFENAQQRETQITSTLSVRAPITTSPCDDPKCTFLMQIPTSSSAVSISSGSGAQVSASLSFEQRRSLLEEAQENSVASDCIPSPQDDRDSLSVATEYSLKFDESMTEDEIEERSFRSLLPSESHRRGTLEKKQNRHEESEEEPVQDLVISLDTSKQENGKPFSSGQNDFSRFTMEMVRQYMKEEEVRAQHQSSLLQLRQRALKEKTKAELAWLEHLKKHLRDKGEDDKMPPIRKKQRVLLLKLQQEQAEIKRLQEANKAARKERQLLLKQQEDIERMHTTTLRLRERLKSASHLEPSSLETMEEPVLSNMNMTDANSRSTSPLSVSGSETSSILQRLKKMHSHMDEKFLTKREQQLKRRRSYAEELLQWKQRLDYEEREIRRMERQAMAVWDRDAVEQKALTELSQCSGSASEKLMEHPQLSQSDLSSPLPDAMFSQEYDASQRDMSPSGKTITSPSNHLENSTGGSTTANSTSLRQAFSSDQMSSVKRSSDQNSIESRIYALKEELRKRKTVVHQLKKEQKKRQRERLKAQEANLLKQLESYNDFIKKTKSELSKDHGGPSTIKPEIKKLTTEKTSKASLPQRSEITNNSEDGMAEVVTSYEITKSALSHEDSLSDEDPPTVTPTPVLGSPDLSNSLMFSESQPRIASGSENILSSQKAEEATDEDSLKSEKLQTDHSHVHLSDVLLSPEPLAEPEMFKMHSLRTTDLAEQSSRVNDLNTASKLKLQDDANDCTVDDKTTNSIPSQMLSGEHKTCSQTESSSHRQQSHMPVNVPESQLEGKQASSSLTYGYNDDFESLAESSLITMGKKSVTISEEIIEELSSKTNSRSDLQFEHLLNLKSQSGKHQVEGEDLNTMTSTESSASNSQVLSAVDKMEGFSIGDKVLVRNIELGTLRFKGQTSFARGFWAGVELDKSEGTNNGTCDGVVYFECKPDHGVFVPPSDVCHLPEFFNIEVNTTDDEDTPFDDASHKDTSKPQLHQQGYVADGTVDSDDKDKSCFDQMDGSCQLQSKDCVAPVLNVERSINNVVFDYSKEGKSSLNSGESIVTNLDCAPTDNQLSLESSVGKSKSSTFHDLLDNEKVFVDTKICADRGTDEKYDILSNSENVSCTFADQLFKNFVTDAVKQFQQIQKAKQKKIEDANLKKDDYGDSTKTGVTSLNREMDMFPLFDEEQDITSPELYNRQGSPVLDASGQQELAKRLAELELSRELLDVLGDEPDWFDEDFGLSSRKEQRQKHPHLWQEPGISGTLGSSPIQQVKTPPRPELPLQSSSTPEKPAMIVPHDVLEVEKLVYAATQEIWDQCKLGMGKSPTGFPRPKASVDFLGGETTTEEQATYCKQSYKKAVFDLSWEVIKDMYAKDHNAEQPQWMKPQRIKSSYFHGMKCIENIQTVQSFLSEEVLKLYGLKREQNQKTDWQKMLKFGRKKRDRVDHILVQELHDEESLWVNYDEDELYVKMQLADGIFDALLKDTEDVLSQIQERRSSRAIST